MSEGQQSDEHRALVRSSAAEYLTFVAATGDGGGAVELRYKDENIWLTQKLMAELYGVSAQVVSKHLQTLFESGELQPESAIKRYLITAADGKNYNAQHYSLQAIVAVGFDAGPGHPARRLPRVQRHRDSGRSRQGVGGAGEAARRDPQFERYRIVQDRPFKSDYDRFLEASGMRDKETGQ